MGIFSLRMNFEYAYNVGKERYEISSWKLGDKIVHLDTYLQRIGQIFKNGQNESSKNESLRDFTGVFRFKYHDFFFQFFHLESKQNNVGQNVHILVKHKVLSHFSNLELNGIQINTRKTSFEFISHFTFSFKYIIINQLEIHRLYQLVVDRV